MDGNKTRFVQLQTGPNAQGSVNIVVGVALRGHPAGPYKQVFPNSAFCMSAAQSLPAVKYQETGEEKL
jgi:hypothetical protein